MVVQPNEEGDHIISRCIKISIPNNIRIYFFILIMELEYHLIVYIKIAKQHVMESCLHTLTNIFSHLSWL